MTTLSPPAPLASHDPSPRIEVRQALSGLGLVGTGGLLLGGLTSWGQVLLPEALQSFANSASGWTVCTLALLLFARLTGMRVSALAGAIGFATLSIGYAMVSTARGFFFDPSFWIVVGVPAGLVVGAAVATARRRSDSHAIIGFGVLAGLLAGDGVYGLTNVLSTTSWVYWALAIVMGLITLSVGATRVAGRARELAWLVGTAVAVAALYPSALRALGSLLLLL